MPALHAAQLVDAWLAGVEFRENLDFDLGERTIQYSITPLTKVEFETAETALYRMRLNFGWRFDGDLAGPEIATPFDLSVEVVGRFAWVGGEMDREYAEGWLEFNATYLLWPYARSYVSAITGMSSLSPLTLYTLQVPRPRTSSDTAEFEVEALKGSGDAESHGRTVS